MEPPIGLPHAKRNQRSLLFDSTVKGASRLGRDLIAPDTLPGKRNVLAYLSRLGPPPRRPHSYWLPLPLKS